jgi:hypothetical protein
LKIEDDVTAAPNYMQQLENFVDAHQKDPWAVLEVCPHGFIGKLFRSADIPKLVVLLRTFFLEKPCDYLIRNFYDLMLQKKVSVTITGRFPLMKVKISCLWGPENHVREVPWSCC